MIRRIFRRLIQPFLWWAYRKYSAKKRWTSSHGIRLCLYPSVFHPIWMLTTTTLLNYIKNLPITERKVLELGAGNGLVALWCAKTGALVTASDINPAAIRSIEESAQANRIQLQTTLSDLFAGITAQQFDFIFINPPYFPKKPKDDQERAFFCGENFEYFHALFQQLAAYTHQQSTVLMILTDDCELEQIASIAQQYNWRWEVAQQSKKMGEQHLIYKLFSSNQADT